MAHVKLVLLEDVEHVGLAGDEVEDDYMDEITDTVYRDFFGDQFVDMNVRFH